MKVGVSLPSGERLHSNGKWPIEIVDFPIKHGGSFHGKMLVHQAGYPIAVVTFLQRHLNFAGGSPHSPGRVGESKWRSGMGPYKLS